MVEERFGSEVGSAGRQRAPALGQAVETQWRLAMEANRVIDRLGRRAFRAWDRFEWETESWEEGLGWWRRPYVLRAVRARWKRRIERATVCRDEALGILREIQLEDWPDPLSESRGLSVEPLRPKVSGAAKLDLWEPLSPQLELL